MKKTRKLGGKTKKFILSKKEKIGLYVAVFVMALFVSQFLILAENMIFPNDPILGLRFNDAYLGQSMIPGLADKIINTTIDQYEKKPIAIEVDNQTIRALPQEIGLDFNSETSKAKILATGRTGNLWQKALTQDLALIGLVNVPVTAATIDETDARAFVEKIAQRDQKARKNAYFDYVNGKEVVVADQSGLTLNNVPSLFDIEEYLYSYKEKLVFPVSFSKADITEKDLQPILPQAQQIVAEPLALTYSGKTQTLSPKDLNSFLTVKKDEKGLIDLTVDQEKVNVFINGITAAANTSPVPQIIEDNNVIQEGKPGLSLDTNRSETILAQALLSRNDMPVNASQKIELKTVQLKPTTIYRKPKYVSLTIDDVPNSSTAQILDVLKVKNVHVTFFVIGSFAQANPDLLKRIVAEGHTIGNHSFSHPYLTSLTPRQVSDDLSKCQQVVKDITGVTMTVWRPPYSAHNATTDAVAKSLGLSIMMYNDNPNDSTSNPGPHIIAQRVLAQAKSGSVVIIHSEQQTLEALPEIIDGLRSRGYKIK